MVWHFALYTQTECTVDCGSARAILPLMSLCILSLLWASLHFMSLLGSFVFGRENDGLFGSRLLGLQLNLC